MMEILDNELGSANVIVLTIDGATPRFSGGLYDMLRQMSSIFGEIWYVCQSARFPEFFKSHSTLSTSTFQRGVIAIFPTKGVL